MSPKKQEEKKTRESGIKLGIERYGDMPIEECFRKAFQPYFDPKRGDDLYMGRLY